MPTRRPDPVGERLWRKRLAMWKATGLKVGAFCEREGVTPTAFAQWRKEVGKIVMAGREVADTGEQNFVVAWSNADGSLDDGSPADSTLSDHFGTGGFARSSGVTVENYAVDLAIQPDGRMVGGRSRNNTSVDNNDFLLARFLGDDTPAPLRATSAAH